MRRADRLFQVLQYLRGGRLMTAAKLAARLEVSERTVYRDIADLQANGVPIEGEAGVGYILREGFELPPLMFTKSEITALVVGARMVQAWGGSDMAASAAEALVKIDAVLPAADRQTLRTLPVHTVEAVNDPQTRANLDLLNSAIADQQAISTQYIDATEAISERRLEPLGLHYWGRVWTLVAWCQLREDYRSFRVDRFAQVALEDERFRLTATKSLHHYHVKTAKREDRSIEDMKGHFF